MAAVLGNLLRYLLIVESECRASRTLITFAVGRKRSGYCGIWCRSYSNACPGTGPLLTSTRRKCPCGFSRYALALPTPSAVKSLIGSTCYTENPCKALNSLAASSANDEWARTAASTERLCSASWSQIRHVFPSTESMPHPRSICRGNPIRPHTTGSHSDTSPLFVLPNPLIRAFA